MKKLYFKKLLSSFIFNGAAIFTLLFFSPLEVYLGNPTDFRVSIYSAILILGLTSLVTTVVFSLIVSFLPVKALKIFNLCVLGGTLCFYVQSLFLNGALIKLDGEKLELGMTTKIVNLVIWILIFGAVIATWLIFKRLKKEKFFINITKWVALALVLMQLTGAASLFLGYDTSENDLKDLYFSSEGRLEVSKNNNVIYFIIDYCDGQIVKDALKEDPKLFDGLDGFTYYPDNLYVHSRSYPAITYLLSGEICRYDKTVNEYINDSFDETEFITALAKTKADIRYYTDPNYVGAMAKNYVANYRSANSNDIGDVRTLEYLKQTVKVTGFRGLPYVAKERFAYESEDVNDKSLIRRDDFTPINKDLEFYEAIKTQKVSVNKKYKSAYRFYHMYGSHPGATINENAEYEAGVTLPQALRGDMKIIKTYLDQLKELGVYDNSTIIITADHGRPTGRLAAPQTCLMLVKEAGADSTKPIKTSTAPVSHENLFATVLEALGGNAEGFNTAITKVKNKENTRYTYLACFEVNSEHEIQKYEVKGSADDIKNYKNVDKWPVKHTIYR